MPKVGSRLITGGSSQIYSVNFRNTSEKYENLSLSLVTILSISSLKMIPTSMRYESNFEKIQHY